MNQNALKPIKFLQPVFTLFVLLFVGFGLLAGLVFDTDNASGINIVPELDSNPPVSSQTKTFNYPRHMANFYVTYTFKCPVCGKDRYYYELHAFYKVYRVTVSYVTYLNGNVERSVLSAVFLHNSVINLGYGQWGRCPTCEQNRKTPANDI